MRALKVGVVLIIMLGTLMLSSMLANTYSREVEVVKVENNVVVFEDDYQHEWKWEIEKGQTFTEGQTVKLVMDKNNTENCIKDDVIKRVVI